MNPVAALVALLTIQAAGFGLAALLIARCEKISLIELLVLSWLLGTAFLSLTLPSAGLLFRGLALQMAVTVPCVLLGYLGIRTLRANRGKISLPLPANKIEAALCAALLLEFAAVAWMQYRTALGWDGLLVWEVKARYAFLNNGVVPLQYFTDQSRVATHPDYPLMIPMLETWLYLWLGDCHQSWARVFFPIFYFATALMLFHGVTRLSGKRWAGLAAALMLFFVPYPVAGPWNIFAGYADLPLAAFCLAAMVYFLRYQDESSRSHLVLVSVMAGMMPWMKKEGIVLWFCMSVVVLAELLRRGKPATAALVLLPGMAVWSGWKIASALIAVRPNTDFFPVTFEIVEKNLPRLLTSGRMLGMELMKLDHWSLLWIGLPVALGCLAAAGRGKMAAQILFCIAAPLLLLDCAFVLSSWPYYQSHIRTSLPRLVLQVVPLALLAIGLAMGRRCSRER